MTVKIPTPAEVAAAVKPWLPELKHVAAGLGQALVVGAPLYLDDHHLSTGDDIAIASAAIVGAGLGAYLGPIKAVLAVLFTKKETPRA